MHDDIPAAKNDGWGAPSTPVMLDGNATWHSKTSESSAGRSMSGLPPRRAAAAPAIARDRPASRTILLIDSSIARSSDQVHYGFHSHPINRRKRRR
jgi:hypothetical protein